MAQSSNFMPACQVSLFPLCIISAPSSVHAHRIEEDRIGFWSHSRGMRIPQNAPHLEALNLARLRHGISPARPDGHDHAPNRGELRQQT